MILHLFVTLLDSQSFKFVPSLVGQGRVPYPTSFPSPLGRLGMLLGASEPLVWFQECLALPLMVNSWCVWGPPDRR